MFNMEIILQFHKANSGRRLRKSLPPAGVTYDQFLQMSNDEKYNLMDKIIKDDNIKVPDYLDDSASTKVIYALGMNNKPTVVSDSELDKIPGNDLYRGIRDNSDFNISAKEIADQLKYNEYTQLSKKGSSLLGRGIYFAPNDFLVALDYASAYNLVNNGLIIRAKINPNAKMSTVKKIGNKIKEDSMFNKTFLPKETREKVLNNPHFYYSISAVTPDSYALYAIAHGIDGWRDSTINEVIMINRRALTFSSTNKRAVYKSGGMNTSWTKSEDF
ncbi:MAG: hypothetical protein IJP96_07015 [Synergistaceae bacterium]|nr:hypothetical protein [Synergistaceae bacterium]